MTPTGDSPSSEALRNAILSSAVPGAAGMLDELLRRHAHEATERLRTTTPTVWSTTADVAKRYCTVPGTVRYWRHIGYGPKGTKVGRRVLYSEHELSRFDASLNAQVEG